MSIYDKHGNMLFSAYSGNGAELDSAYDASGNLIFSSGSADDYHPGTYCILGDSYSTYEGYTDRPWYPENGDLTSVDQTWWKIFEASSGLEMMVNASYSGSCICYDGYGDGGHDQGDSGISFLSRMDQIGYSEYIFIFGGTNDSWVPVNVGDYKYSDWTETDKEYFRPALAFLIDHMMTRFPRSNIVFIKNTDLGASFSESIDTICDHYGITEIQLSSITKANGHPTASGMLQIAAQVLDALGL